MRKAVWVSGRGHTLVFCDRPPYFFTRLTDSLGAEADTVKSPLQDGGTTQNVVLGQRSINLTGTAMVLGSRKDPVKKLIDRRKNEIAEALNPKYFGTLVYYTDDGARQIRCRPVALPTIGKPTANAMSIDVDFISDAPYWESAEQHHEVVGILQKLWRLPWHLPMVYSCYKAKGTIENPAAEPIYPVVEIMSVSQLVRVVNVTTGKFVQINRPIAEGQKMVIDMGDYSATIYERGSGGAYVLKEDVSHWLTLDSEPVSLMPGKNVIDIKNEDPDNAPETIISYRNVFVGV